MENKILELTKNICRVTQACHGVCNPTNKCNAYKYAKRVIEAGYEPRSEWISVDERLPDEDGEYLTWNGLIYFLIWFNASLGLWNVSEDGDTSSAISGVTHWMPLPEPPKKGGAE